MRKYEAGTVVEVVFPFEEENASKRRPALVLSDDGGATLIVTKITSRNKGRRWDVCIKRDQFNERSQCLGPTSESDHRKVSGFQRVRIGAQCLDEPRDSILQTAQIVASHAFGNIDDKKNG